MLRPSVEQGQRVRRALLRLPDQVARELDPAWFAEGGTIRVADAFVVDLLFSACGETLDSLVPHVVSIDLDGVEVRTLDIEGLLKTKQSARDKDRLDRAVLERALRASKGESLRVFQSCPLITPEGARSSLQMLAVARATAALCA